MANQEGAFFVAQPHGTEVTNRLAEFGTSNEASEPSLEEPMFIWRTITKQADSLLHAATEESLARISGSPSTTTEPVNLGTLLVRNIFHYWVHIGEISAIRQVLGHPSPPEFVGLHGWKYNSTWSNPKVSD